MPRSRRVLAVTAIGVAVVGGVVLGSALIAANALPDRSGESVGVSAVVIETDAVTSIPTPPSDGQAPATPAPLPTPTGAVVVPDPPPVPVDDHGGDRPGKDDNSGPGGGDDD
ncbi:hypothetical protein SCB71_07340 [Herbiconiux sp. KACC 21604]|uniref:hypothetical protein n=1 Tax=unclassified Herbiconiux TaxID=2618217 RepID=UPI0014930C16|nr:hypothetical protein [Herbiconiux sp. SALV-R1]QJU53102.1 hypothetical protein HL652_05310 [Herbiconiux sp. SALV-R1]WPO88039.1 hypothetical protein SCB71_07340 [Herbiconiux sp. KACC 21604]